MDQSKIDRINALARKAKLGSLSEDESRERALLRREYIDSVKASLTGQLDNTFYVDEQGNQEKLKKKQS